MFSGGGDGGDGHGGNGATTGSGTGTNTGAGDTGSGISLTTSGSGQSTGSGSTCDHAPDVDGDGDGWTTNEGDCNDCDPNVNPGAIDVLTTEDGGTTMVDVDCNGTFDPPEPCDTGLAVDSANAIDAAKAVDLCRVASQNPANKKDKTWGVVHAAWVLADGSDPASAGINLTNYHLGHGMLNGFGPNVHVQGGQSMLGLSSGTARQPTDSGYSSVGGFDKLYTSGSPAGFPKESPACPNVTTGTPHDSAAVELTIRTPTNATGFTFDFNFFTYEWPAYVCSQYNDFFVALLSPIPQGQVDGNISFDSQGNPVSVNNALVDVCDCATTGYNTTSCSGVPAGGCCAKGKPFACALGTSGLQGTGFDGHASTGWLVTKAPVKGGETITLRWTVYDSGDGVLDSTTLIDNWKWIANGGTVVVGTDPIKTPQ
ncbi:Cell division protein FtsH [Minicystis rosea]|nr:Cell division protein FtsH [Minicystis rosea]